jgi:DNA-binding GntR family transcriptional regulator
MDIPPTLASGPKTVCLEAIGKADRASFFAGSQRILRRDGVMERGGEARGGSALNLPRGEFISRRSLHDELTERLRGMIERGDLEPGQKIPEKELCERLGVSRTPLREALKVLASEGAVTLEVNRGAKVRVLKPEELDEVFAVMGALEALAGEIACLRITDKEVQAIRKLHDAMIAHWKEGEMQAYFRLNLRIHESILDATRNETLKSVYRNLSGRILSARYVANMSPQRWTKAVADHEVMLQALAARDGAALSKVLKTHLANKLATVKEWLVTR